MAVAVEVEQALAAKLAALFPHLDERQRRLAMGAEARLRGHGGMRVVGGAARGSAVTVSRGMRELEEGGEPLGRARRRGGGRKSVTQTDPGLKAALLNLVEPASRGDPESPLRWTTKSTRNLADELYLQGIASRRRRWPSCWVRSTSACRATPRRSRAVSIRTEMPSSATSTIWPASIGAPEIR